MKSLRHIGLLAAAAGAALAAGPAVAQRQPPNPEQRLERLERQMNQVQRQVFPRGRPADTAGFAEEPAATQSSVATLDQRLDSLERQMADLIRQSEENGHRLQTLEADLAKLRTDQEQRIATLEQRVNDAAAAAAAAVPAATTTELPATRPPANKPPKPKGDTAAASTTPSTTTAASTAGGTELPADPGEDAYSEGFHLWEAGNYDQAIAALRSFIAAYPKHGRISYANNLIGRAQLDKGDARGAAETLLANYRSNPGGARAQDSLYYLGQALMKLGQPGQACNVYQELESVYASKVRADLKKPLADAKVQAGCR